MSTTDGGPPLAPGAGTVGRGKGYGRGSGGTTSVIGGVGFQFSKLEDARISAMQVAVPRSLPTNLQNVNLPSQGMNMVGRPSKVGFPSSSIIRVTESLQNPNHNGTLSWMNPSTQGELVIGQANMQRSGVEVLMLVNHSDGGAAQDVAAPVAEPLRFLGFPAMENPPSSISNPPTNIGNKSTRGQSSRVRDRAAKTRKHRQWTAAEKGKGTAPNFSNQECMASGQIPTEQTRPSARSFAGVTAGVPDLNDLCKQKEVGGRSFAQDTRGLPDISSLSDPVISGRVTRVVLSQAVVDKQFAPYQLALVG
ncbi:hypothetical protein NE237_031076 [Protea cynaroides]|uniref:Uncharacterized protein n=1 Tax=Protea cynaroides TaxID=273540 RepID=A0A9Q0L0T7_9MAGN|nr:hypothetical protein NE237_031076 [Protea cynaroides]